MTRVVITTELGTIEADLYDSSAPNTVANFVKLAKQGFYDDVIFHRVIPNFMIQGGDGEFGKKATLNVNRVGTGGPGYRFADEPIPASLAYNRGTMAMANAGPNTNGSQFFIMHRDYGLPKNYTIFGQVTKGLDVVDAIVSAPRNHRDLPDSPTAMVSIEVIADAQ